MANDLTIARKSVTGELAARYGMEPDTFEATLRATCMPTSGPAVTREEFAAFILVCKEHGLNPVTREIFAMRRNTGDGLVPVVSVDGWAKKINEHPSCNGFEFRYSENVVTMPEGAKPCPDWCEISIWRKDRDRPIVIREFLDETYQPPRGERRRPGAWQTHTKRMLRHKTLVQGARLAFGFAGIYDEDEAERIIDAGRDAALALSPPARSGPPRGVQEPKTIEHTVLTYGPEEQAAALDVVEKMMAGEKAEVVLVDATEPKTATEVRQQQAAAKAKGDAASERISGPPRGVSTPPAPDPKKAYKWPEIEALFTNQCNLAIQMGNLEPLAEAHARMVDEYEFTPDELDRLNVLYDEAENALQ